MDYDKLIIDLLNRIVTLEERVSKLENKQIITQPNNIDNISGSKKYRYLSDYLLENNEALVKLSFREIEDILKIKLPDSALTHRTFWANTTSHSIALSWLSVNYCVTEVNLENQYVFFEKKRDFDTMKTGKSTVTTEENYLSTCKSDKTLNLYKKLRAIMFDRFEDDVFTAATSYYVHWDISGRRQRQFAIFYIQKEKIRIETLVPRQNFGIGENIPDTHGYTLNYRTDIFDDTDFEKVEKIILDSYNQIKKEI